MDSRDEFTFRTTDLDPGSDAALGADYTMLWEGSAARCPFQSPAILGWFNRSIRDRARLFALRDDRGMQAAVVLRQDASGGLSFLSDLKTDVNRFLFHRELEEGGKRAFFIGLLRTVIAEGRTLTLNSQLGDHPDTALLLAIVKEQGMWATVVDNSACPVLEAASPEELFAQVDAQRELRYRVNKLRNQKQAEFEVFTDQVDLETWTADFQQAHISRWEGTDTPSRFRDPERRQFLLGCLQAWAANGLLVRFSVRTMDGRTGFVIGLRAPGTIIHHSTTYHPCHAKFSPGKALLHTMAGWMRDNGLRILDFGDGREPYKYSVATSERPLQRIFIGRRSDLRFRASSSMIRMVRGNQLLYGMYQRHLKRRWRS